MRVARWSRRKSSSSDSGVGFFQLDVADVLELPGDQVLGPPAQVDERLGEVAAQYDLAGAELDRRSLYGIEGAGHFGNLVLSRDRDGQAFGMVPASLLSME